MMVFRTIAVVLAVTALLPTVGHAGQCPSPFNIKTWTNCIGSNTDANGTKYTGEWKNGKFHGQGTEIYANGDKYVVEYKDGKPNGQGTFTKSNGNKYVGEIKDGRLRGQGTYTFAHGGKYVGSSKDDKFHGQGTRTYADGREYVGEFKDGKLNGQGTFTSADGRQVREGIWENGKFLYVKKLTPPPVPEPSKQIALTFPSSSIDAWFRAGPPRPDDIAVIIGNADYKKRGKDIPNVIPAYADAAGMKKYVIQSLGIREDNIIFLKDATQARMISTFGSETNPKGQLFNYVKAGKSRVFVYYSGHGAPGGKDGDSYLVPSNAQASLIDLNGYPLSTLYKNLGKIPAKSVTVVLEACFSGASQSGSLVSKASPIFLKAKETNVPANITVIAAGAANQIASWEQDSSSGLFTKYFLKGMSGEADTKPYGNSDGKVGYDELGRYFKETLTYYARRYYGRQQTPQIVVGSGG